MLRSRISLLSAGTRGCVFVAGLGAGLLGCDPELVPNPNIITDPPAAAPATIYFVQAAPELPAVDVYIDGSAVKAPQLKFSAVGYHTAAMPLRNVQPATYKVELRPAGAAVTSTPLVSQSLTVQAGRKVLLTAMGRASETAGATKLAVSAVDLGTPSASGVKLRLLHASPSAPIVDLVKESTDLIQSAEYGKASYYAELKGELAGATKLTVRSVDGMANLASVTVPNKYAVGSVLTAIAFGETNPLAGDRFLSFAALDEASGQLTDLPLAIDSEGKSRFIAVHASPDGPSVDVFAKNGAKLIGGLVYQKASVEVELAGNSYDVDVKVTGMTTPVASMTLKLLPSTSWTIFATGLANSGGAPEKALKLVAVPRAEKGDATLLRIVHASPGTVPIDVKAGTQSLAAKLAYTRGSAYLSGELQGNVLKFVTTTDPKKAWDVTVPQALLNAGEVVSLFATGIPGDTMRPFSVFAVTESRATAGTVAPAETLMTVAGTPPM